MKTEKIFKVCGSIIKKESLVYLTGNILENTSVAEADQPYSNYYGVIPDKPKPNSLFLFTGREYSLEEALRFTQNIDICAKNLVNAASAVIYAHNGNFPALRIRNFPDYVHLRMLQECYQVQGVEFTKRSITEKEAVIKVSKCFALKEVADGFFFDLDEEHEGYFTIPWYPGLSEFEELLQNIRNNSSCSLFDAALGGLIVHGNVKDIVRIYSGHLDLDLLKCIKKETLRWMGTQAKISPLQGVH